MLKIKKDLPSNISRCKQTESHKSASQPSTPLSPQKETNMPINNNIVKAPTPTNKSKRSKRRTKQFKTRRVLH